MVMRPKKPNRRRLLAYFMESKLWKQYKIDVVNNRKYWIDQDGERWRRMFNAESKGSGMGYTIEELILDMINCVDDCKVLAENTKIRLFAELDELEQYHTNNNSIKHTL